MSLGAPGAFASPPSQLPVSVVSSLLLSLPVIAAEVFSAVQMIAFIPVFIRAGVATLASFTFAGVLSGFATLFIGFYSDFSLVLRPRFLLLSTEFFYAIGLILILVVDYRIEHYYFEYEPRLPYAYLIVGFTFMQIAINALQLCGRSLLAKHLPADQQSYAHTWAATFLLGCSFVVKLVFGLSVPVDSPEWSPTVTKGVTLSFASFALLLVSIAIIAIPDPSYAPPAAIVALFGTDGFPNFFKLSLPLLVGQLGWTAIEYVSPYIGSEIAPDEGIGSALDGVGYAYIGIASGALVGIAGAWLQRTRIGTRGALVLSLLFAAVISQLIVFVQASPTIATLSVQAALAGLASGALASGGWSLITADVPREAIGKYIGIVIALSGTLRGVVVLIAFLLPAFFVPLAFVVAAMLAFVLPATGPQGG